MEERSLGRIWNRQLKQHLAPNVSALNRPFSTSSKLNKSDLLSGLLQMRQKDSGGSDSFDFRLYFFWRLRDAKLQLRLSLAGILLKSNGVSFPAVLTIVHSRDAFSSWNTKAICWNCRIYVHMETIKNELSQGLLPCKPKEKLIPSRKYVISARFKT